MKRFLKIVVFAILLIGTANLYAQKNKGTKWVSIDQAEVKMREQPKKVFIDIYTNWCGWCKRMDATTFSHPVISGLLNQYFYPVKLNAEQKDTIKALGREFAFMPNPNGRGGINQFAAELMQGSGGYPTSAMLNEKFQYLEKIPGYKDAAQMEYILRFYIANAYQSQEKALEFRNNYIPSIKPAEPVKPITH